MAKTLHVKVLASESFKDRMPELEQLLRKNGMNIQERMDAIGVVTGSFSSEKKQSIQALDGVDAIEEEEEFRIAPPDSPVQ